jgi:hypothetical protein
MIAITRHKANIGFLMYIVDSIGYLGYNILLIAAGFIFPNWNLPQLFFSWITILGFTGLVLSASSWFYFKGILSRNPTEE